MRARRTLHYQIWFSSQGSGTLKNSFKSLKLFTLWNEYLTFISDQVNKTQSFSDDSSETLWLAIAFISSTESCVFGYNAALYKRVSLARRRPKHEHRFEFSSWCCVTLHDLITPFVIVSNIKHIIRQFFVFWKLHSKSTWFRNQNLYWAWRLWLHGL